MFRSSRSIATRSSADPSVCLWLAPTGPRLLGSLALLLALVALFLGGMVTPAGAATAQVTNCHNSGAGSLRDLIGFIDPIVQPITTNACRAASALSLAGGASVVFRLASAPAVPQRSSEPTEARRPAIAWRDCGDRLQCARVRVPLDWDRPHGRKIKLAVIRQLASRPGNRIGSLFINPGGPGGSVQKVRDDGASLDAAGGGRFDVVGWDIRGAGSGTTTSSHGCGAHRSGRRRPIRPAG